MRSSTNCRDFRCRGALAALLLLPALVVGGDLPLLRGGPIELRGGGAAGALSLVATGVTAVTPPLRLRLCDAEGTPLDARFEAIPVDSAGSEAALTCGRADAPSAAAHLTLDCDGALGIRPLKSGCGIVLETPLDFAILPSRQLDDTIYELADGGAHGEWHVPPENLLVGLCAEGNRMIVLAWSGTLPSVTLRRNAAAGTPAAATTTVRLMFGDGAIFVGLFDTAGIWYRRDLEGLPLEQPLVQPWQRPFAARWITQLPEGDLPVTFEILDQPKPTFWRAGPGFYVYPAWFEQDRLVLQLGPKIPARGTALVYALEGHPRTPYAFLRARLAPAERAPLAELAPVKGVTTLPMPDGPPSGWATACRGRDRLDASILRVGIQARERLFLEEQARFRARQARATEAQNSRYADFIARLRQRLAQEESQPASESMNRYRAAMRAALGTLEKGFNTSMRGKSSAENLADLDATVASFCQALRDPGPERLVALRHDLGEMNASLDRLHAVGGSCGPALRAWFQAAAREAAETPEAMPLAMEIRREIRAMLAYRHDESIVKAEQDLR